MHVSLQVVKNLGRSDQFFIKILKINFCRPLINITNIREKFVSKFDLFVISRKIYWNTRILLISNFLIYIKHFSFESKP